MEMQVICYNFVILSLLQFLHTYTYAHGTYEKLVNLKL